MKSTAATKICFYIGVFLFWGIAISAFAQKVNKQLDKANKKLEIEDYQGALLEYDKAIAKKPMFEAYCKRSVAKYFLKDFKGAILDLDQALQLDQSDFRAYYQRAYIKFMLGDYDPAIED